MAHPGRHLRRVFGVKSWCFTRLCKKCWMRTTILGGPILAVVEPRAGPYILKSCCIPLRPSSQQTDPLPKRALCLKSGTTCRLEITGHVGMASETMFGKPLAGFALSHKHLTLPVTWGGQGKLPAKQSCNLPDTHRLPGMWDHAQPENQRRPAVRLRDQVPQTWPPGEFPHTSPEC